MKPTLYTANVKFEDTNEVKSRPVLVLSIKGNIADCRKVTSSSERSSYPGEYPLQDWKQENLTKPSVVRMSKHILLSPKDLRKRISVLTEKDIAGVKELIDTPYKESFNEDDVIDSYVYEQFVNT